MFKYILHFLKVFVIAFSVSAILAYGYFLVFKEDYKPCNSDTTAVHYHYNLPSNPPLKVNRRWV